MNCINYISKSVSDTVSHCISKISPGTKDPVSNSLTVVNGIVKGTAKALLSNMVAATPLALAHLTDTRVFVSLSTAAVSTYSFLRGHGATQPILEQLTRGLVLASSFLEIISFLEILPETPETRVILSAVLMFATLFSSGRALKRAVDKICASWNDQNLAISDRAENFASGAIQTLFVTSMANSLYHSLVPTEEPPLLPYSPTQPLPPGQPDICELETWISPGHGFVRLNCDRFQNLAGFYPATQDDFCEASTFKAMWSFGPIGVGATKIAAPEGVSLGEVSTLGLGSAKTTPLSNVHGMLKNDQNYLNTILKGEWDAAVNSWPLSLDQAARVHQYVQEISEKCNSQDPDCSYNLLFHNCLSFVDDVAKVAGLPSDWPKHLMHTPSKTDTQSTNMEAFAWHWMYLVKKASLYKKIKQ